MIALSWGITVRNAVLVGWMYWPDGGLTKRHKKKIGTVLAAIFVMFILLVIFRNVILDWLRDL